MQGVGANQGLNISIMRQTTISLTQLEKREDFFYFYRAWSSPLTTLKIILRRYDRRGTLGHGVPLTMSNTQETHLGIDSSTLHILLIQGNSGALL